MMRGLSPSPKSIKIMDFAAAVEQSWDLTIPIPSITSPRNAQAILVKQKMEGDEYEGTRYWFSTNTI